MTATTIKVSAELRDRLKAQAGAHDRTIGEHIEALLAEQDRRERFAAVRRAMTHTPPDDDYVAESRAWQSDTWS